MHENFPLVEPVINETAPPLSHVDHGVKGIHTGYQRTGGVWAWADGAPTGYTRWRKRQGDSTPSSPHPLSFSLPPSFLPSLFCALFSLHVLSLLLLLLFVL